MTKERAIPLTQAAIDATAERERVEREFIEKFKEPPPSKDQLRDAFEAWAADKFSTHRHAYHPERYLLDSTNMAWRVWQAGYDHRIRSSHEPPADQYKRMFENAVMALAQITRALDVPDEVASVANGNQEILDAIDALKRAAAPPVPARCHCGAHEWPDGTASIEDSRHRLHTLRGCQPSPTKGADDAG